MEIRPTQALTLNQPANPQTESNSEVAVDETVIHCRIRRLFYGNFLAVRDTELEIPRGSITAFIGPSGCGKSTVLRSLNRMNDLIPGFRLEGEVDYHGNDIYHRSIDPVSVRRYIGMVFQQPNPFAMSIYNNIAFGLKICGVAKAEIKDRVETALQRAAIWNEVKDKLRASALSLSGGQQQRLCIARAIATEPDVLLMDEPCSALDPIATRKIEDLMQELKKRFTIAIVTHNLQQAERVSNRTAFMYIDSSKSERTGYLVEHRETKDLFETPREDDTKRYLRGEFS